ncbi:MAG: hypothetical protein QM302_04160 [Acidobacteriota bacterium]|nr:hypothetical protein [Acidobacteriota bacterium]
MGADYYFTRLAKEEQWLKKHGFDHYPSDDELLDYAFSIEDRVEALCQHIDIKLAQDVRGRWHAIEREDEDAQW